MKYQKIKKLPAEKFRRETGVKKETFNQMIEIIKTTEKETRKKGGRKNKLPVEERLLMTLEYLREYRTFFHISNSYEIGESTCHENITKIENILIKSKKFSLPKRKELLMSENEIELVLIDAAESPIERPKRTKKKP